MNVNISNKGVVTNVCLEANIIPARQVIWIGAKDEKVYNTICVDTPDTFLCTISYDKDADHWLLTPGQTRTECSRGIKSNRSRACSMCRGCCGYIRTANPDYTYRKTSQVIKVNDIVVDESGVILREGDTVIL